MANKSSKKARIARKSLAARAAQTATKCVSEPPPQSVSTGLTVSPSPFAPTNPSLTPSPHTVPKYPHPPLPSLEELGVPTIRPMLPLYKESPYHAPHTKKENNQLIGCWGDPKNLNGRKPNKTIDVPLKYRRRTHKPEREELCLRVKQETSCDVLIYGAQNDMREGRVVRFEVFGLTANVQEATKLINRWINAAPEKSSESAAWAKIKAHDWIEFGYSELRQSETLQRNIFKDRVPESTTAMFKKVVHWDDHLQEKGISPKDVFGADLSALDEIRTRDEVWIRPIDIYALEILSYSENFVETAEQHLTNMILKARMHHFGASHPVHIILDESEGLTVSLTDCEEWWPSTATYKIVPRLNVDLIGQSGAFRDVDISDDQRLLIRECLRISLESIRFEKAHYSFSIRFGCFAMARTQPGATNRSRSMTDEAIGQEWKKGDFLRKVNDVIDCEAKSWAWCYDDGEMILTRMMAADHLLEPAQTARSFGSVPEKLEDIRPVLRGVWVFSERIIAPRGKPNATAQQLIMIEIDWTEDENGLYEKGSPVYYRLKGARPTELIDLKLLELSEGKAWQFSLLSKHSLPRKMISPSLEDFARQLQVDRKYDPRDKLRFVHTSNISLSPKLKLEFSRQERVYQFGIKETDYHVELYSMWYPNKKVPCWGLNVMQAAWADHLAELEHLNLGEEASWGRNTVNVFFPDGGAPKFEEKFITRKGHMTGGQKKRAKKRAYLEKWGLVAPKAPKQDGSAGDRAGDEEPKSGLKVKSETESKADIQSESEPASESELNDDKPIDGVSLLTRILMELSKVIHGTGKMPAFDDMPALQPEEQAWEFDKDALEHDFETLDSEPTPRDVQEADPLTGVEHDIEFLDLKPKPRNFQTTNLPNLMD